MKKFSIISLFLLLSAAAFGQVAVQQAPGTYTDNSIVRRDGTYNKVQNSGVLIDDSDGLFVPGVISAGSGPTTLTDASGKILSAALNIVAAAQGGFGANVSGSSGVPLFATGTATFTGTSGTGNFARVTSPTFVTPSLGVATGTSFNGVALTTGGSSSTYLDGTGAYSTPAGGGDMTLAGIQTVTGAKTFNSGKLILAGSTSGTSILNAAAIAGATTITLPNANSTLPIFGQQITFAGPTAARTVTFPDASFTVARTDAANTFTGVQTMTSPATTTSITTASTSFTAWAGATTLLTFGGTGASASTFFPSTLDTSSSVTGAIRTSGGISAAKALNIGTTATIGTTMTVGGAATFTAAVPQIVLGVNTTTKGGIKMFGNTSGDVTISPLAVAGTATALTFPAVSGGLIASATAIGTVTGTPSSSNFLRGDGTWATPSGSGTVTVVASGSLTSTALVTGGGTTTLQTPSATATMDGSGNISTPGTVTIGSGASTAGAMALAQGTTQSTGTTNITIQAPTSVTSYIRTLPGTVGSTGYVKETVAGSVQTESVVTSIPATDISSGALSIGNNAATVGTVELGNTTDTTLSRSAAGVLAVEGVVVDTVSATNTLTNKRITARVTSISSSATPTVNTDNCDCVTITALAVAITSMTTNLTGTPVNFDQLEYRIKDDGTARAITWGASFVAGPTALPTTTVISKALHVWFEYDSVQAKWVCVSSGSDA